jgi:low temperature requirement protein LtrA
MVSNDGRRRTIWGLEPAAPGARVTRLELFYDLVFVFAGLSVTAVAGSELASAGLVRSLLVVALLWFPWTTFARLGNAFRADLGIMPLVGFATMGAVFVAAVAIPDAFGGGRRWLPQDVVFAACYALVRALQVLAFWYASRHDRQLRRRWRVLAVPPLVATVLLFVAAAVPGRSIDGIPEFAARAGLWVLAIAVEYGVGGQFRTEGLTIVSAGHWAERYSQIILIALGESILSLGTGAGLHVGLPLTLPIIGTAALGIAVIAALWWAYFDFLAIAGERALHRCRGAARIALARDAYTYLHLPMVAGIILFALGLKRVHAELADPMVPSTRDSLGEIDTTVLYGGVILYFLALLGFQLRIGRPVDRVQLASTLLPAALIPVAGLLPAVAALGVLVLLTGGLLLVHRSRVNRPREQLRRAAIEERRALEAEETRWRREHQ